MKEGIVILGAGAAGMSAAYELYRNKMNVTIIEKDNQVGGLAKTYQFGEFRTDNGPHRFYSKNKYLYDMIGDLLGEHWIKVNRFTRFYINGKYFKYPIEIVDTLKGLGFTGSAKVMRDFLIAKSKNTFAKKEPANFEDYIVSNFGRTLAELNMLNYTEKIWGIPCSQISIDWADQRIKELSFLGVVKDALLGSGKKAKSLVDEFYYPDMGTGLIYEKIKEIIEKDNKIMLNNEVKKINHKGNKIISVETENNGKKIVTKCDTLVSSIPITDLINCMQPGADQEVKDAMKKIRFRSQVYLFMTLNKERVSKDNWIYFPDKHIPIGRIHEPKNFSSKMSPDGKTSLFIEFFCFENDEIWNMEKEKLFDTAIGWLDKLGFVKREEVIDYYIKKQHAVYPVYDLEYKKHLTALKSYLDKFENLMYIGRPGRFKYTNQDHSIEMGVMAARSIVDEKKYDIEQVGAGTEYFEKGYAPLKEAK